MYVYKCLDTVRITKLCMYCPERQRFSLLYVLKSDLKKKIANKVRCGHQSSQLGRGATLKLNYLLHTLLNANRAAENDNSKLQYAVCDFT